MFKVAICGKANSGKNTLGNILSEELRSSLKIPLSDDDGKVWKCEIIAFADPIKEMARQMFPSLPKRYFYGSSKYRTKEIPGAFKDDKPLTIRQLLIDLGTGVGRDYKENVWIEAFDYKLKKAGKKSNMVIVTDVRFKNEFLHLKKLGFYQIRLLRDSSVKINHSSETNQDSIQDDEFDAVIHNNGTLKDLTNRVIEIIPELKSA